MNSVLTISLKIFINKTFHCDPTGDMSAVGDIDAEALSPEEITSATNLLGESIGLLQVRSREVKGQN